MDAFSLAMAGYASTAGVLDIIQSFTKEENYTVLMEINRQISVIQSTWYREDQFSLDALSALKRKIFSPKIVALGYTPKADEDILTSLKRALVISAAAKSGDQEYHIYIVYFIIY